MVEGSRADGECLVPGPDWWSEQDAQNGDWKEVVRQCRYKQPLLRTALQASQFSYVPSVICSASSTFMRHDYGFDRRTKVT